MLRPPFFSVPLRPFKQNSPCPHHYYVPHLPDSTVRTLQLFYHSLTIETLFHSSGCTFPFSKPIARFHLQTVDGKIIPSSPIIMTTFGDDVVMLLVVLLSVWWFVTLFGPVHPRGRQFRKDLGGNPFFQITYKHTWWLSLLGWMGSFIKECY